MPHSQGGILKESEFFLTCPDFMRHLNHHNIQERFFANNWKSYVQASQVFAKITKRHPLSMFLEQYQYERKYSANSIGKLKMNL